MRLDASLIGKIAKIQVFPKKGDVIDIDRMQFYIGTIAFVSEKTYDNIVHIYFKHVPEVLTIDTSKAYYEIFIKPKV